MRRSGDTMTGNLVMSNSFISAGTLTDVVGTVVAIIRNNAQVGRLDNNAGGVRLQAQAGTLQLRGTGNLGISIDAAGKMTSSLGQAYTVTNPSVLRSIDAGATSTNDVRRIVATLIADLQSAGPLN